MNRERPAFVIVHPDDRRLAAEAGRRGRPLREALRMLADAAPPDPAFAEDMMHVLASVGTDPTEPWPRS